MIARFVSPFLKAHAAGLGAAVTLLLADLAARAPGESLSLQQWAAVASAFLGVSAVTALVPNTPKVSALLDVPDELLGVQDDGSDDA